MSGWREWYSTRKWRRLRAYQLAKESTCRMCAERGKIVPATIVDHITPHHGDAHAFLFGELQSVCEHCHNADKRFQERRGYSREIGVDGLPTDPMHPANRY